MPLSENSRQAFEGLCNHLASEAVLAQPGRDDGLIPSYSLLTDMLTAMTDEPVLREPVAEIRARLDALLDGAGRFDEAAISALFRLIEWLRPAIEARAADQPVPPWSAADAPPSAEAPSAPAAEALPVEEQMLSLRLEENAELLAEFHAEALDHLVQIESSLLVLDETPDDRAALDQIFRSFHTIKGVSGFLHLTPMHVLTHEVESLLDLARTGRLRLTPKIITAILKSRDAVQEMVGQITLALEKGALPDSVVMVGPLIRSLRMFIQNGDSAPPAEAPAPAPVAAACVDTPAPATPPAAARAVSSGSGCTGGNSGTVRVNIEKLESMMNVVGELVIVQSQIAESARDFMGVGADSPLARNIAQLGRITKELQRNSMALRLMPIKPAFQKMERLARDLAAAFEKRVVFSTEGEETEIDRTVVEEIADPLVHMVRNALDHGLERPADRLAAGKPEQGSLSLKAYNQGSSIVIELADDGRGIDPDRILKKAVEKGLVPAGASLTRDEIYQLIFAPGFSTAEAVTAVSGRGVGMDVVKRNIERLRGVVHIASEVGKGTTFRIRLPLTTAIIDGLIVRVGGDRFILPSTSVQMALRPPKESLATVHGRGEIVDHRGRIVPVRRLHRQFRIPGAIEQPEAGILVILETHDRITALLVDELLGKQEVVVKNLGGYLADLPGVAGGAILGDGNIALILDPASLVAA